MQFELKNIKINKALSEETCCYSAVLLIDGKRAGEVSNRGNGGADNQRLESWVDRDAVEAYIAANHPPLESDYGNDPIPCDLELLCARLLDEHEIGKTIKAKFGKNIVYTHDKKIYVWAKAKYGSDLEKLKPSLERQFPGGVLLNERPIAEAVAAWKAAGLVV